MTLFHRNVAVILNEVEDFLTTLRGSGGGSGVSRIRGQKTNSDIDGILKKIETLKKDNPNFKTQLEKLKKSESDYSGGSSNGGGSGSGGVANRGKLPAPSPTNELNKAPIRPESPKSEEDDIYETLPGNEDEKSINALSKRNVKVDEIKNDNERMLLGRADSYIYASEVTEGPWSNTSASKAMEAALFSGVVQKLKKSKFAKNFKPRFCVLRDGHILVYDKASDAKPKEVIDLSTCSVKETSTEKNSFKVWGPCKEHEFNVESREAMIKWMDTITTVTMALATPIQPVSSTDTESEIEEETDYEEEVEEKKETSGSSVSKNKTLNDATKSNVADADVKKKQKPKDDKVNEKRSGRDKADEDEEDEGCSSDTDMDLSDPFYTCAFICKWDFKSFKHQQVSASKGEVVDLLNKDYDEFGWWTVQSLKGKVGLMPKKWLTPAYEKIIVD